MELLFATIGIFISLLVASCATNRIPPPKAAENVSAEQLMGMWYEIARLPFGPQRDCAAFASRYEKISDEEFGIVNYCRHKSANGPMRKTRAAAYLDTTEAAAKLKVQLRWPAWYDLWILYVDDDYSIALLGTPDRKNLWLLSRTPSVPSQTVDALLQRAEGEGFDIDPLIRDQAGTTQASADLEE